MAAILLNRKADDSTASIETERRAQNERIATLVRETIRLKSEDTTLREKIRNLEESRLGPQGQEIANRMLADPEAVNPANLNWAIQSHAAGEGPNPLLPDGATELVLSSPDAFAIRISRYEDPGQKGLLITLQNDRLAAIGTSTISVLAAQSFDFRHKAYRDGRRFVAFSCSDAGPIDASYPGKGIWLVRKQVSDGNLAIGNESGHPLEWPPNDGSPIHKWLLSLKVTAQTVATRDRPNPIPLAPITAKLVVLWNREENEFFIEQPGQASA